MEKLVTVLEGVVDIVAEGHGDAQIGALVREFLAPAGDLEALRESCAKVRAYTTTTTCRCCGATSGRTARSCRAWRVYWSGSGPASRARRWLRSTSCWRTKPCIASGLPPRSTSASPRNAGHQSAPTNRRYVELYVLSHMVYELRSGDLCGVGSHAFADYRSHLLPGASASAACRSIVPSLICRPTRRIFVVHLKQWLSDSARTLDRSFPDKRQQVTVGANRELVLRRTVAQPLDVLANIEHWTQFTRHFGPLSGSDTKIRNAAERYLPTIFAMGCNPGPDPGRTPYR